MSRQEASLQAFASYNVVESACQLQTVPRNGRLSGKIDARDSRGTRSQQNELVSMYSMKL